MTFIFTLLALFSYVASAPISARDVFVPPVLYPRAGTVWKAGETYTVTWYVPSPSPHHRSDANDRFFVTIRDISNPPAQITNKQGEIVLSKGGYLQNLSKITYSLLLVKD